MRVLWIVNMVLPHVAKKIDIRTSVSGGWLVDYAQKLAASPDVEFATMTYANVKNNIDITVDGGRNFILAGGGKRLLFDSKKTVRDCENIIKVFNPDIIHIHGTEYAIGNAMLQVNRKYNIPVLLTIQGILARISQEYYGGLPFRELCKMIIFKDLAKFKTPFTTKLLFEHNALREKSVLNEVKYVTGRTTWDKAVMLSINPNLRYYRFNYNLREEFYAAPKWSTETMIPHTIFVGASSYSLKGMHIMLDALQLLVDRYPDVTLVVPGGGYSYENNNKANGYQKYIIKKILKSNLMDNVVFVGNKNAGEIVELLRKANVCVVTSAMEGASATICEAMMIGTPCICSYRGGMTDLLRDGDSGYYYDFPEYGVLAAKISSVFDDLELCKKFSKNTIIDAERRHNREENFKQLIDIYRDVIYREKHNEGQ